MRIAMFGLRGIPARLGGVERYVEEVSVRLASRGHRVTVFCRPQRALGRLTRYRGVRLGHLPALSAAGLENASHSFLSGLWALSDRFDLIHIHNLGPAVFAALPWALGKRVVTTVHALDYRQRKWGKVARASLVLGERSAVAFSHGLSVVSRTLAAHYREQFGAHATVLTPGLPDARRADWAADDAHACRLLERLRVEAGRFLLAAGRITPDKRFEDAIDALGGLEKPWPLVIAGAPSPGWDGYAALLAARAPHLVRMAGALSSEDMEALYRRCAVFVHPSRQEGLCLAILEALAFGAPVLASDIPENREILVEPSTGALLGAMFRCEDVSDLAARLQTLLDNPAQARERANIARERAQARFSWERCADLHEALYRRVAAGINRRPSTTRATRPSLHNDARGGPQTRKQS